MAEDPVIDHILDERAADLASGHRAEEGVQDWFATRLSTHQPSFGPRGMRGHGASYAIHRSAWKWNSRKFISTILNIRPYRAGAVQHLATPMDRMLPQDVVGLDKDSLS